MAVDLSYIEDCKRVRSNWSPEDGMTSSVSEFFVTINEPLSFVWLSVLALFLWKRSPLSGSLLALISFGLLAYWNLIKYNLDDGLYYGRLGGCVGSLTVTNVVLLVASLIGIVFVFLSWRRRA